MVNGAREVFLRERESAKVGGLDPMGLGRRGVWIGRASIGCLGWPRPHCVARTRYFVFFQGEAFVLHSRCCWLWCRFCRCSLILGFDNFF